MKKVLCSLVLLSCLLAILAIPVFAQYYESTEYSNLSQSNTDYMYSNMNCVYNAYTSSVSASTQLFYRSGTTGGFARATIRADNGGYDEARSSTHSSQGFVSGAAEVSGINYARTVEHYGRRTISGTETDDYCFIRRHNA